MFKVVLNEYFGPFCGEGGYGSETRIGMDKSPKRANLKARSFRQHYLDGSQIRRSDNEDPKTGICGGGVPILYRERMYKDGKLIKDKWS